MFSTALGRARLTLAFIEKNRCSSLLKSCSSIGSGSGVCSIPRYGATSRNGSRLQMSTRPPNSPDFSVYGDDFDPNKTTFDTSDSALEQLYTAGMDEMELEPDIYGGGAVKERQKKRRISNSNPFNRVDKRRYPPPTNSDDFAILDNDDDNMNSGTASSSAVPPNLIFEDNDKEETRVKSGGTMGPKTRPLRPKNPNREQKKKSNNPFERPPRSSSKRRPTGSWSSSWMDKNDNFGNLTPKRETRAEKEEKRGAKHFVDDFQGTRVFVDNIPDHIEWKDLKDHFRIAGEVIYASISTDSKTGRSKGHGIVDFETTEEAQHAIRIMRDHPLDGTNLYVREDVQRPGKKRFTPPPAVDRWDGDEPPVLEWYCDDRDNEHSEQELEEILAMLSARDDARRRKNYEASDQMRRELRERYDVHLNDREKKWWTHIDYTPKRQALESMSWKQIPTTMENDALVDPELVMTMLTQRDMARKNKDFLTADDLLERAIHSPDGGATLRIHDDSRTWRIWTEEPPKKERETPKQSPEVAIEKAIQECYDIVNEHAPDKMNEVKILLEKFKGREFGILKKLRHKYLD